MAAFTRDRSLPASRWLAKVSKSTHLPRNSVYVTFFITVVLTCINFGSNVAFNAIISSQLIALDASSALTHTCVLAARVNGRYRRDVTRWNIGIFGAFANVVALFYDLFLTVFLAFPGSADIDTTSLNWGPVIFIATTILALLYYAAIGRNQYRDPSKDVVG